MTTYDIIYDAMLLDAELEGCGMRRNFELFDGDDGYVSFIEEKVNEYEKMCDNYYFSDENFGKFSTYDAVADFVEKNLEKWKRELRGDNLYKVKIVLEFDVESADSIDSVVDNVKEIFYNKTNRDYGCDAIKNVRVVNAVGKEVNE